VALGELPKSPRFFLNVSKAWKRYISFVIGQAVRVAHRDYGFGAA
jgi:hypothetical protein